LEVRLSKPLFAGFRERIRIHPPELKHCFGLRNGRETRSGFAKDGQMRSGSTHLSAHCDKIAVISFLHVKTRLS
jgi:hypothetical protein